MNMVKSKKSEKRTKAQTYARLFLPYARSEKVKVKKSESEHGIEQTKVKENKRSDILHGCSSSMPAVKS